jgi:alkylhydroperoxidase family enzyme
VSEPLAVIAEPGTLPARERLAIAYTKVAMADSNAVLDAFMAELSTHFSDPELVELSFLIGYISMLNLFNNLLHVRYHGEYGLLRTAVTAEG